MTTTEFSNEFDILYNNITSNQAPGLNEYEKSVFLTKAQIEVLKNYFNPKGNKYQEGFDGSEKRQIDFSSITKSAEPDLYTGSAHIKFDDRSIVYSMPNDILFVLNETIKASTKVLIIVPINFEEYSRVMSKPFQRPLKNQAWRLFQSLSGTVFLSEIIAQAGNTLTDYKLRYVKRPTPIILVNLNAEYDVSIEGLTVITQCELDPILHPEVLQRAVELAKMAYVGDINSIIEIGKRSE